MPPDAIKGPGISKILKLSVSDIGTLLQIHKSPYRSWEGDLDGGTLEQFLDKMVPNHIRAAADSEFVYFIDKQELDYAIDNLSETFNSRILQRILERTITDWYHSDYIDYYCDLLDPVYEHLFMATGVQIYVNLYDYIIERIVNNPKNRLTYLENKIQSELFKFEKWRDDDPDYNERYDTVIRTLKELIQKDI